jgi:hypothetical protein
MSDRANIFGVELLRTGRWLRHNNWPWTCNERCISDLVDAGQDSRLMGPVVKRAVSRHRSAFDHRPMDEGRPAYGRVENLRASDSGQQLLGDLIDIPSSLPEGGWVLEVLLDVSLRSGKTYRAVLTALSARDDAERRFDLGRVEPIDAHARLPVAPSVPASSTDMPDEFAAVSAVPGIGRRAVLFPSWRAT